MDFEMTEAHREEGSVLQSYLPKLIRLADRNLSPQLRQKVDENDITSTVLRTVIRRAREGQIAIQESEDFWRLLVAITLNKVRRKARYWKAMKRNMAREQPLGTEGPTIEELAMDDTQLRAEPTEADGEALVQTLDLLTSRLSEPCQKVLSFKFEGLSHLQIAERMEISTRSVTRHVATIQEAMRQVNDADESS